MAEGRQFPLVTCCKLTISNNISTKGGKLYKLITDKHQFKIVGFDPLVIEKDSPSQQDIVELLNAISAFNETQEIRCQTLNKEKYLHMPDAASNPQQVKQVTEDTGISVMTGILEESHSLENESYNNETEKMLLECEGSIYNTVEQYARIGENKEFTNFKQNPKLDNSADLHLVDDIERLMQDGRKNEGNMHTTVQPVSEQHKYTSQEEIDSCESYDKSQGSCIFSLKASSFHVAMFYFLKSSFQKYFEHAETDGTIFTFKLNAHIKRDVEFLDKIKQLEFEKYEFVHEDWDYVRLAMKTVKSEVDGLTLDIIGHSIHIIGSKNTVASARRKLDSLLQDQNPNLLSEHLHSKNTSTVKDLEKDKLGVSRNSDRHEKDIPGNEYTHGIIKSQGSQNPTEDPKMQKPYSSAWSSSLHERSDDPKPSDYRLTHLEASGSDVYSNIQNDNCILSERSQLKVNIYRANIVMLKVDCIVNPSNEFLLFFGRVATAIEKAAGAAVRQECEDFINAGNAVEVTNIFVTTGGKLPVKCVMHAVGPKWDTYNEKNKSWCLDDLRHTVMRCLVEADRRGLTSVALPSISAAFYGVPHNMCTKCYMDAVKHFDIIIAGEKTSLREIHFVDVDDAMVTLIRECFATNWSLPCDPEIVLKDHDFCKNHVSHASQMETASYRVNYNQKRSFSDYKMPSSAVKKEMAETEHLNAEKCETSASYNFGKITLKIDSESRCAFDQTSDVTITIGEPFDKLSGIHDFRIKSNLKQSEGMDKKENTYEFLSVSDPNGAQSHVLCKVYPEPENAEKISEAFINLEAATSLQNKKELVLTSSVLYALSTEPTNKTQKKAKMIALDRKMVGNFAQCLYSYLDKTSKDTQDNICVTVVGSEEALLTIERVIDSHDVQKIVSGGINKPGKSENKSVNMPGKPENEYANTPVKPGDTCEFCYENMQCLPVICCRKLLCLNCKQSAQSCPFCSTFWRFIIGNQPLGSMKVSQVNDHADGYENVNAWKIDYYFSSGTQEECHPSPGKMYDSITRTAYLPSNIHGLQVLMLLRLSFIRKLTFTIGHSLGRSKDDVIIWNDISHKTSLHGGTYGYPDPSYLDQVTVELASKGVKLDIITDSERLDLAKFRSSITSFRSFSDI